MSVLEAIVLGAVQGLTEFVPISSSGHLVIVPDLFGWDEPGLAFDVLLHSASLGALAVYFRSELIAMVRGIFSGTSGGRRLILLLLVGTIPAAIVGSAFEGFFEDRFDDAPAAALSLLGTAVILVAAEWMSRNRGSGKTIDQLTLGDAGGVGAAQALAILPGISRSGSTIGAGLLLGMDRSTSARFAFLLAIPALLGASLLQLPELGGDQLGFGAGVAGFCASLITSYIAIAALLRFLVRNTLYPFALYCAVSSPVYYLLVS